MRRALCVGIDFYPFGELRGCVNDADRMASLLRKHEDGTPDFDCRSMRATLDGKGDKVGRPELRKAVKELFAQPAEVALLHFSGHGTVNDLDGYLVTQDAAAYDEGLAMSEVLKMANDSKTEEVVIILDCCHAGNLGNPPVVNNARAMLREGMSILTASRGDQVSVEASGAGLFTSLVADALEGGAADVLGDVTAPAIYAFVEGALGAWDQRPLFKSHVSKVLPLRKCKPVVDLAILRELPTIFPVPAEDLPLTPAFEHTCEAKEAVKTAIFCKLQALQRVHLVVPVDAPHMYDAAMQSKACRLTASGRYYWRLAKNNRI
ncbi:MAG: caspase family protein [Candidatus Omnitrophota bacterium]|nr:caspase family protein [Candidatus Omnitrophota bacterium]